MRPDGMLETFSELAVKEPDLMRIVLQAGVAALVNVQNVEAVKAEMKRRAVNGESNGSGTGRRHKPTPLNPDRHTAPSVRTR